ncbi:SusC/RagA family TonB-linked outer membrane protein [Spirosoma endbachense]|uniref:SusC/RagA family TonB-linked outer membrane protein n=1 Tax=Spirosoma endbachense TaxID=2666025 RepID=A0A6P1VY22_9BACT|nr:SusC/RagA family TonB-linked outer membrane protein [Spirosoma endbachense]QHV97665.1 SusC/RagA family TonB-linked outer membrane protein [Spirosoma endbachense]
MKKLLPIFLLLLGIGLRIQAQTRTITGRVSSPENEDMPGVSILIKGSNTGTVTTANGTYQLAVPAKSTLVFSFIGYKTMDVAVGDQTTLDVRLVADLTNLDEVVVTANAIVREKKELGYAVSTVGGSELVKARDPNLLNSLAGRVAGVRITQQSGSVGGSSRVVIRGANSLSSASEPLFVVDGIPISNSSFNNSETDIVTGGVDVGNRASDLNPDDIEAMTVLKGAAASALYGSRARNGVIVVTTKRGKVGSKKMNITLNTSYRTDNVLKVPDLQTDYAQGNLGVYNPRLGNGWGPKISSITGPVLDYKGEQVQSLTAHPQNWKNFFVTGNTMINSIAIDGASDQGDYRVGYTNLRQTGTVPGSELTRNTFAINAGRKITSRLLSRAWLNYVRTTSDGRPQQGSNTTNIIGTILAGTPVTVDINELRNNLFAPATQSVPAGWTGDLARAIDLDGIQNNPYFVTTFNKFSNTVDRVYGGTSLSYDVAPWLNLTGRVGTDFFTENRRSTTRRGTRGRLNGQFDTNDIFERELQTDLLGTVTRQLSTDWTFKGIVGHQFNQRTIRRSRVLSDGLNIDQLYTFANAQSNVASNFYSRREIYGLYGDFSFDYKNYLFLNVTGRNDWSSTLPVDNNSYFYPSASASFVLTEAFPNLGIVHKDILSYAKLRANYANVGSDEDPYQLAFTYNPLTQASDIYTFNILYPIGGASAFGATNVLPPTNLRPQQQTSYEFGAELKFFGGRLGLDMTYYKTFNYDQIISIAVPQSTGYSARRLNVGELSNKGIEAMLTVTPLKTRSGFRWDAALNFNRNVNRVESLAPGLTEFVTTSGDGFGIFVVAKPGETFNIQGVGWLRDPNGNIVINPSTGLRTPGPRRLLGSIYPDWTMGISNSVSYKGFDFSFLIDIRKGGVINSQTVGIVRSGGLAAETAINNRTPFIDPGVIRNADGSYRPNDVPVASVQQYWSQLDNSVSPETNTFDGSFTKLREVRLAYNFPRALVGKTPFSNISLGVEGRNLWIIHSNVPHIDPEANVLGTGLIGEGLERGSIPSSRSIGANLRLAF